MMAILSVGCGTPDPPKPQLVMERPIEEFHPPDEAKSLFIFVVDRPETELGYGVYVGPVLSVEYEVVASTPVALKRKIREEVDDTIAKTPDAESIIIRCEGSTKTGDVESVRSSLTGLEHRIYVEALSETMEPE
ncbi:hypothetical protein MFFC18_13550 [Mariniblastus fucicola]|uniref:Uncharacterized protein n=2 Tax=Mariniblastus fucicola TaxID=980251 RepID=A0A5B9P7L7_9BACT|nr:hypothetical protein MFFC18_13550 [Mariniblastus fucicola]